MPENKILAADFFRDWDAQKSFFEIQSSGSTGPPKLIKLSRNALTASAKATGQFLNVTTTDSIFCCLPLDKISGFMQLVRSKIWFCEIQIAAPSYAPFMDYRGANTITSLTAMQLGAVLANEESKEKLNQFRVVLIGGGDISAVLENTVKEMHPLFYHTYGMTETCSHVAMRRLNAEREFRLLPGVEMRINPNRCIEICGEVTDNEWIKTNDIVEMQDSGFRILGRIDNVINSGGIKLIPEIIEAKITAYLELPENAVVLLGVPDDLLGERAVLVVDQGRAPSLHNESFEFMENKYERPRAVHYLPEFVFTETGKPKRDKIREVILAQSL